MKVEIKSKINNITSKVISNFWGKLEQINFDFTFKNGKSVNLTHEVYGKSDGVAMLLYNTSTQKIILTKQFRMPVLVAGLNKGYSIEVVGGALDKNESPKDCAIRETEEEVGYLISKVEHITTTFLSPGILKEKVHLFLGEYKNEDRTEKGGGLESENEEIEVLEILFSEALKMVESQEIVDARTIILLQYLKMTNLLS